MNLLLTPRSLEGRSDVEAIDPRLAPIFLSGSITSLYFAVALLTALVYHSAITLDKEIRYFWADPLNSVSIIYFANRFFGLLTAICDVTGNLQSESPARCVFSFWVRGLSIIATIILIDYILLIRVVALYHGHKALSVILKTLIVFEACTLVAIFAYSTVITHVVVGILTDEISICGRDRLAPKTLSISSWVLPMAYGFGLLCLMLYKAIEFWKLSARFNGLSLVRILIQDQVLYYAFVIFCCVCNIMSGETVIPFVSNLLGAMGSSTFLCILGGQLLINLKEAGEKGSNGGTNYTSGSVSGIYFGENVVAHEESTESEGSF